MDIECKNIIDYLDNKLPDNERAFFEQSLESSKDLRQKVEKVRFVWKAAAELKKHQQVDTVKNWRKLSHRVAIDKIKCKTWHSLRNVAAILILPFIITTLLLFKGIRERDNAPVEQVELNSANGLISKVTLPDGSEVWLNSGSKLSYPQRFTGNIRNVHLSGEAYFKVNADPANRFIVSTNDGLSVKAYGTEFNVCAYEEDQIIETTLVSGHINVGTPSDKASTNPSTGQQAIFNKQNGKIVIDDINVAVATSWKDGKMIFRRAGMQEVARRLSRNFNVDIRLDGDELHKYEYSATFTTETLAEILYLLGKTAPIDTKMIYPEQSDDYTFTKHTVIISMKQ